MITCHECGEAKPDTEFRKSAHRASGRLSQCNECIGVGGDNTAKRSEGYIDEDAPRSVKQRNEQWYIYRYNLDDNDLRLVREAAKRVVKYRRWYLNYPSQGHGEPYPDETAEMYVDRMMGDHEDDCATRKKGGGKKCTCDLSAGEPTKRRIRILQTALARALPQVDITTRTKSQMKEERRRREQAA